MLKKITISLKPVLSDFLNGCSTFFKYIKYNRKIFLVLFLVFLLAFLSIMRANYYYVDDIGRAAAGYNWSYDFNRYSSSFLQVVLINMNAKLVDLSPYTQILAIFLTTISCFILLFIFTNDKKPKFLAVAASAFLGLSPFATACNVFKFDAPCMALGLFAAIFPFVFYHRKLSTFAVVSFISLFVMWTSFQAFSGIYLMLAFAMLLKDFLAKDDAKIRFSFTFFSVIVFLSSALFYKFCLPSPWAYRPLGIYTLTEIIPGFFNNLTYFINLVLSSFNIFWAILLIFSFLMYIYSFLFLGGNVKKKIINILIGTLFLVVFSVLSFGACLILQDVRYYPPRQFAGVSVLFSVVGLFTAMNLEHVSVKPLKIIALPMILLIYQFFVFEIAFGNALADQKRYASFRSELLAGDLSELMSEVGHNETEAQIQGSIGLSIVTEHVAKQYPITYSLISDDACGLSEHNWSVYTFILNYRQDIDFTFVEYDGFKWGVKSSRSSERNDFEEQHSSVAYDVSSMEKLKDSFYHTIYSDGTTFVIVLKQDSDSR